MKAKLILPTIVFAGIACPVLATLIAPQVGDLTHSFHVQARLRSVSVAFVHVPTITKQELPQFPDSMRLAQIAGEARASFELASSGEVKSVKVQGTTREFADATSAAVKTWRFGPVTDHQGKPVSLTLVYDFRFEMIDVAYDEGPNKALEPTPTAVTSPAAQEPRQP